MYDNHAFYPFMTLTRPPHLGSLDVFSKKLTYVCSSALNDQFLGEKCTLASNTAVPQPKMQKNAVCTVLVTFRKNCWGANVFEVRVHFSPATLSFDVELET